MTNQDQHTPEKEASPDEAREREKLHDELVIQLEEHTPEGHGAVPDNPWLTLPVMVALALLALTVGTVVLWLVAGWLTGIVALILVVCYLIVGWAVAWMSGILRAKEHEQIEREVEHEIRDLEAARRQGQPPAP
jgi:hypothetical protein